MPASTPPLRPQLLLKRELLHVDCVSGHREAAGGQAAGWLSVRRAARAAQAARRRNKQATLAVQARVTVLARSTAPGAAGPESDSSHGGTVQQRREAAAAAPSMTDSATSLHAGCLLTPTRQAMCLRAYASQEMVVDFLPRACVHASPNHCTNPAIMRTLHSSGLHKTHSACM